MPSSITGSPPAANAVAPGLESIHTQWIFLLVIVAILTIGATFAARSRRVIYASRSYKRIANVLILTIGGVAAAAFIARSVDGTLHELMDPSGAIYLVVAVLVLAWPSIIEVSKDGLKARSDYWDELQETSQSVTREVDVASEKERSPVIPSPTPPVQSKAADRFATAREMSNARLELLEVLKELSATAGVSEAAPTELAIATLERRGILSQQLAFDLLWLLSLLDRPSFNDFSAKDRVVEALSSLKDALHRLEAWNERLRVESEITHAIAERAKAHGLATKEGAKAAGSNIRADILVGDHLLIEVKVPRSNRNHANIIKDGLRSMSRVAEGFPGADPLLIVSNPGLIDFAIATWLKESDPVAWTDNGRDFSGTDRARSLAPWLFQ